MEEVDPGPVSVWKHRLMDDAVRDELAGLRARAYGPHADIAADPAAVARLAELEEIDRAARATEPDDADHDAPHELGTEDDEAVEEPVTSLRDADDADGDAERDRDDVASDSPEQIDGDRPRFSAVRSTRSLWLWAGTVAAVAAVASAATAVGTTLAPVARSAGVAQVDTLQIDPGFSAPPLFWPASESVTGYRDYLGLTAVVGPMRVYSEDVETTCLYLVPTADIADSDRAYRGGQVYGGCGAGSFPPTAQFVVTADQSEDLRERFPVGTSLQFVLDGERVGVFSDAE